MGEKGGHMSEAQKKALIAFMESEKNLLSGKFSNNFTYKDAQKKWQDITGKLNSIPGANKQWIMWRRTWQDLKKNVKKKNTDIKHYTCGTGGGPPILEKTFTEDDENIFKLLNKTSVEGNENVEESVVIFDHDYNWINGRPEERSEVLKELNVIEDNMEGQQHSAPPEVESIIQKKRKRVRLTEATKASQNISRILEKKSACKENYYEQKLKLSRRDVEAKERLATALESLACSMK